MAPEARVKPADAGVHGSNQQDESPDSQLVTIYMHRLHGAGERSSSPIRPRDCDGIEFRVNQHLVGRSSRSSYQQAKTVPRGRSVTVKNPAIAATVRAKDEVAPAGPATNVSRPPPTARAANASNNRAFVACSQQSSESAPTTSRFVCQRLSKAGSQKGPYGSLHNALNTLIRPAHHSVRHHDGSEGDDNGNGGQTEIAALKAASQPSPTFVPRRYSTRHPRRKMELSQSPTQSNNGRSYEQYLPRGDDLIPSDGYELEHLPETQQSANTSANEGTNRDDDTGVVNFDFSAMGRQDTQVSYPDPYDPDGLQQSSPAAFIGLPETPAPPRNPFADSKASLIAASQLFRQTQTSSAHETFSPTSSRPSPDNIQTLHSLPPHPATSSPLKQAATIPSPLLVQFPDVYNTSPHHATGDLQSESESQENHTLFAAHKLEAGSDQDVTHKVRRLRQRGLGKGKTTQQRLRPITLSRPSTSDEIVPSTNRETMLDPVMERLPDHSQEDPDRDSENAIEDTQVGALGSQNGAPRSFDDIVENANPRGNTTTHISSNEAVVPNTASSPSASAPLPAPALARACPEVDEPQISESNFTHILPRALGEMMPNSSEETSKAESFTNLLGSSLPIDAKKRTHSKEATRKRPSGLDSGVAHTPLHSQAAIAETSPLVNSSPPPPAFSTRARMRDAQSRSSEHVPTSSQPPASLTSSLSRLGATPDLSDETTPVTEESPRRRLISSLTEEVEMSPAVAKANRRNNLDTDAKPKTNRHKSTQVRNLRSRRSLEFDESTDELAGSPSISTPVYQQNARLSRYGKTSIKEPPASRESSRGGMLFAGMAFAISFQSKQIGEKDSHYNSRIAASSQVATKIKQGGGKVLTNGFDQLFEVSPVKTADRESTTIASTPQPDDEVSLALSAGDTGFTALIADGHSRKVKYMQALALGLPCIHERWVTTCVEKQKLVDWFDYLLCAGNSAFLGDAIRSRNLSPYDATTAKLSQTIQHRPRLLNRSRILLIMSRAEEQKKMAYVFLARVLGASLSRVYTMEEARKQLKARENAGHPYDWVYLEEKMADSSSIFSDSGSHSVVSAGSKSSTTTTTTASKSRKRKRRNEAKASLAGPPPKRIRTLSDELVVQSLILGRLMDEDEMTV